MQNFPQHYDSACAAEHANYTKGANMNPVTVRTVNGYRLEEHDGEWQLFSPHGEPLIRQFSPDELMALHVLTSYALGCSDENCPCYEHGREHGLEAERPHFSA